MRVAPQSSHCWTWPPSAAVRHAVMARRPVAGRAGMPRAPTKRFAVTAEDIRHLERPGHGGYSPGGTTSKRNRSSRLGVLQIVLVATRV